MEAYCGTVVCACSFPFCIAPPITVIVTANINAPVMVGHTGYTLTCNVSGSDSLNPTINYQWTRNDERVPGGSSRILNLPPLSLSIAGDYTCNVTISSALLTSGMPASAGTLQRVEIQSELTSLMHAVWGLVILCFNSSGSTICHCY